MSGVGEGVQIALRTSAYTSQLANEAKQRNNAHLYLLTYITVQVFIIILVNLIYYYEKWIET